MALAGGHPHVGRAASEPADEGRAAGVQALVRLHVPLLGEALPAAGGRAGEIARLGGGLVGDGVGGDDGGGASRRRGGVGMRVWWR